MRYPRARGMLAVAGIAFAAVRITGCASVHTDCQVASYSAEMLVRSTSSNPADLKSAAITLLDAKGNKITSFSTALDSLASETTLENKGDSVTITVPLKGVRGAYRATGCTAQIETG